MTEIFSNLWFFFIHGGWIGIIVLIAFMLYDLYLDEIASQFMAGQKWVFLSIRVPRENLLSTLAVEQIFTQMHALHSGLSFAQKYVEGKKQLWYSMEIVSLGGKISFIIRVPEASRDLVEASFYAQYPNADITEVEDYLKNIDYNSETSDLDLWGTEFKLTDKTWLPIKTYREFEHPTAEDKIVDPLRPLFEGLTKIAPYELYAIQILIRPIADDDWKGDGEKLAKELSGEKSAAKKGFSILPILTFPLDLIAKAVFTEPEVAKKESPKKEINFMALSDMEKERINGVLRKVSKPGYETKIRHMYIAPKDKFDGAKKAIPLGAYRTLGSANTNKFKPDTKFTWTKIEYKFSPTLEAPYIEKKMKFKKQNLFNGFKKRSMYVGINPFILNVEELATIFHLPIVPENMTASPVEAVSSRKSQPPANLPVGEY